MEKRGLSTVVATILLVLLTVIAVGFIFAFAVPFVKNKLGEAGTCVDALNKVELNREYICHKKRYMDG